MATPISATDFLRDPDKLPQSPIYAVFGSEAYLRRKCLGVLLRGLQSRKFEVKRVDPTDSIAPVLDELRSPSMFGGALAVVLTNRREGNRQEATTRFKEEWLAYLENPGKRNVLVFDAATWQRNLTVPKRASADYPTIICEELAPWDTRGWQQIATSAATEIGVKLAPDALAALRDYAGASLARAESELQKLALLCGSRTVSAADVAGACGYEGADVTFPLCDAVLCGDSRAALAHAAKLAGKAEIGAVLSLLGLLRLQVVGLGRAAMALRRGVQPADAASGAKLRLRDNLKAGFIKTARRLDRTRTRAAIGVLLDADETMKTASPDPGNLLLGTVARLCEVLHSGNEELMAVR
jgi:DNA polymerase III delta subunit